MTDVHNPNKDSDIRKPNQGDNATCNECGETFNSDAEKQEHMRNEHGGVKKNEGGVDKKRDREEKIA